MNLLLKKGIEEEAKKAHLLFGFFKAFPVFQLYDLHEIYLRILYRHVNTRESNVCHRYHHVFSRFQLSRTLVPRYATHLNDDPSRHPCVIHLSIIGYC
jgi:hypothetical protein